MKPKTADAMDAWLAAVDEAARTFEIGTGRYETVESLRRKMEKHRGKPVDDNAARRAMETLKRKGIVKHVGFNPKANGGGRSAVYELVKK